MPGALRGLNGMLSLLGPELQLSHHGGDGSQTLSAQTSAAPAKAFTSKAVVTPHSSYMEITRKSSKYKIQYKIALIVTKPEPWVHLKDRDTDAQVMNTPQTQLGLALHFKSQSV